MNVPPTANQYTIPEEAFNVFGAFEDGFEKLSKDEKRIAEIEEHKPFHDHYLDVLRQIGETVGVTGTTLYNPFGGMDIPHQFGFSDDITDVFSQGREKFGSMEDISHYLRFPHLFGFQNFDMDPTGYNDRVSWGKRALDRIVSLLNCRITGIYFFEVEESGEFRFYREGEVDEETKYGNAVVEFEDPETEQTKRFWYLRYKIDFYHPEKSEPLEYLAFAERVQFSTMLLKAASHFWYDPFQIDLKFGVVFDPAQRNETTVITEQNCKKYGRPRRIWKEGFVPMTTILGLDDEANLLSGKTAFGYNQEGELYYGHASNLITRDDVTRRSQDFR